MTRTLDQASQAVREALERYGLLLMQDSSAASMVSIIAGEPVKGSWWSHPKSQLMFDVLQVISAESLVVKLIAGKRTFVHARLCPAVCAVAESREPWQLDALKVDARALLDRVDAAGSLRSDQVKLPDGPRKISTVVDGLEKRLLIHTRDEHTDHGHHARVLQTWQRWRDQAGVSELPAIDTARGLLDSAAASYAAAESTLPWATPSKALGRQKRGVAKRP
jgi:hypothetical protein